MENKETGARAHAHTHTQTQKYSHVLWTEKRVFPLHMPIYVLEKTSFRCTMAQKVRERTEESLKQCREIIFLCKLFMRAAVLRVYVCICIHIPVDYIRFNNSTARSVKDLVCSACLHHSARSNTILVAKDSRFFPFFEKEIMKYIFYQSFRTRRSPVRLPSYIFVVVAAAALCYGMLEWKKNFFFCQYIFYFKAFLYKN